MKIPKSLEDAQALDAIMKKFKSNAFHGYRVINSGAWNDIGDNKTITRLLLWLEIDGLLERTRDSYESGLIMTKSGNTFYENFEVVGGYEAEFRNQMKLSNKGTIAFWAGVIGAVTGILSLILSNMKGDTQIISPPPAQVNIVIKEGVKSEKDSTGQKPPLKGRIQVDTGSSSNGQKNP